MEKQAHDDGHDEDQIPAERIRLSTFSLKRCTRSLPAWDLKNRIDTDDEADGKQRCDQTDDLPFGRHMIHHHKKDEEIFKVFQDEEESRQWTNPSGDDADECGEHTGQHVVGDGTIEWRLANEGQITIDDRFDQPTESDNHQQKIVHTQ